MQPERKKLSGVVICEKCGAQNQVDAANCTACGNPLQKNYYKGLWLRNTFVTLALFFLPFLILVYIVNCEVSKNFEKQIKNSLDYSVSVNGQIIQAFFDERKKDLLSISAIDEVKLTNIASRRDSYRRFIAEKPWFDLIAVADTMGEIVFSTADVSGNISDRSYFRESMKGEYNNSGIFYSDIIDTLAMVISSPFYNRYDEIIGVILATISLQKFNDLIFDLRIGQTSEVFLLDSTGVFLTPSKLGGDVLKQVGYYQGEQNPHTGHGGVIFHRDYRGERVICAYLKLDQLQSWYLVSEMDIKEALAPVSAFKKLIFSIFIIFGFFLIFSSLFFSRQLTFLIKNLTASLKTALDDVRSKKSIIDSINIELRKRLHDSEKLGKQLRLSEEYTKNMMNSISSGLIAIDGNYCIEYCNDYAARLFNVTDQQKNHSLYEACDIFADNEIKTRIEDIFKKNQSFQIEKRQVVVKGNNAVLSIAGFPVKGTEEASSATLLILDITAQEQMREQMANYEKLSALNQLALGAAHEINNPLLGITSYIELLMEEEKDVERKTQAKEVLNNAYRISETIRGLLSFARPTPPKFIKISINGLITETISFLRHQPLFKKIKLDISLSDAIPQITADVNQLRQVLINILINAAQAIVDTGTISITTTKIKFEDFMEIKIIDSGVGISAENLKRIFEPFFTTKKGAGTGLGLSISLSYIKNHNGEIIITSTVNKGTEVRIVLPIRQKGKTSQEVIE